MDPHANPGPVASALAGRRQAWEAEHLSPLAARSWPARRRVAEEDCGLRSPLQRDRDRIVHCKAFRRLKHKTQVCVAPEGDHFRTRLTHTIEVTQISRTVARALDLNEDLVEAIGLGHDLGHPPPPSPPTGPSSRRSVWATPSPPPPSGTSARPCSTFAGPSATAAASAT